MYTDLGQYALRAPWVRDMMEQAKIAVMLAKHAHLVADGTAQVLPTSKLAEMRDNLQLTAFAEVY